MFVKEGGLISNSIAINRDKLNAIVIVIISLSCQFLLFVKTGRFSKSTLFDSLFFVFFYCYLDRFGRFASVLKNIFPLVLLIGFAIVYAPNFPTHDVLRTDIGGIEFTGSVYDYKVLGFFGFDSNYTAALIGVLFLYYFITKRYWFAGVAFIFFVLCFSRGAFVALMLIMALYVFTKKFRTLDIIAVISTATILMFMYDGSNMSLRYKQTTMQMGLNAILSGDILTMLYGQEFTGFNLQSQIPDQYMMHVHTILGYVADYGVLSVLPILMLCFYVYKHNTFTKISIAFLFLYSMLSLNVMSLLFPIVLLYAFDGRQALPENLNADIT